jgi:hypothetical protein
LRPRLLDFPTIVVEQITVRKFSVEPRSGVVKRVV